MPVRYLIAFPLVFILLGADDCNVEPDPKYNCQCWTASSSPLTVGTPQPCANDEDEALGKAISECSSEVGETCDCSCEVTDAHCGI